MQRIEEVLLRIAVTGTREGIRECVRNFALDLPNDISRVEFAPLEIARIEGVNQLGERNRDNFAPPKPRRQRLRATKVTSRQRPRHWHPTAAAEAFLSRLRHPQPKQPGSGKKGA
jgi:hypothetical protein